MHASRGQASVELLALLPLIALAAAVLAQVALIAHGGWAASQAAAAAARAHAVGADPRGAAQRALPAHLEGGLRVLPGGGGSVEVRVRAPELLPALGVGPIVARSRFAGRS